MIALAPVLLFATLSVAAEPRPRVAEVGDAVRVTVSVAGTGLSQVSTATPPKLPDGLEIGPAQGPKIERRIEIVNRQQIQSERLVWYFDLTATRPGTFLVPGFTASNGTDVATSLPFELRATGTFDARDYAFIETKVDPRPRYVGEPITVSLVVGIEVGVIDDLLDGETLVGANWMFDGLAGGAGPESDPWPPPGQRGGSQIRTTSGKILDLMETPVETRKQGKFATLVARRRFVSARPGMVTIGPTSFRAVIGRNFERDLFSTQRIARERKLAIVSAPNVVIQVKPLPEAGRTDAFSGLVGRFALEVEAAAAGAPAMSSVAPIKVKVGDSVRVKVRISGDGNVATTPLLRSEIDGFKRFGVIEEVDGNDENPSRTLVYDVAPVSTEVKQIPPFTFEVFDTEAGAYRTLSSKPIPVHVLPGGAISRLADATPAAASTATPGTLTQTASPGGGSLLALFPGGALGIGVAVAAPALAFAAFAMMGRLRRKSSDVTVPSKRAAAPAPVAPPAAKRPPPRPAVPVPPQSFAAAMASLPASGPERAKGISDAFGHHLAMLAGLAPEAFVGADLESALAPFVREKELRREAAAIAEEADRAAFGGEPLSRDLADRAAHTAAVLERAFSARPAPRK